VIEHYGLRVIIGKGGLGQKSLEAMKRYGAVYLHTVSGAAALLAERIVSVEGVWKKEFGLPEAMWALRVEDLPAIVTMDSHGRSIHQEIRQATKEQLERILKGGTR
jgi:fumarate hydratase class I